MEMRVIFITPTPLAIVASATVEILKLLRYSAIDTPHELVMSRQFSYVRLASQPLLPLCAMEMTISGSANRQGYF